MMKRGGHLLGASSTTQKPIAVSSAEAEIYATAKVGSKAIGFQAMLTDLGIAVDTIAIIETDSSSAKGTLQRRGVVGIKHLDTRVLWLQQGAQSKRLVINKVDGNANVADIGTKNVTRPILDKLIKLAGLVFASGRT